MTTAISSDLEAALHATDPSLLLTCLAHLTGDLSHLERWANAFEPVGYRNAVSVYTVDDAVAEEIRQELLTVLSRQQFSAAPELTEALFRRLVDFATGEQVDDEFIPLLLEQAGFRTDLPELASRPRPSEDFHVAVLGAGMVGINAGVALGTAGYSYTILEQQEGFGGVWRGNSYPGAAVDTPSHYYSFSFDLNPEWSRYYPTGEEYLGYLEDVAERHGVTDHVEFGCRVTDLVWDEDSGQWTVTYRQGGRDHTLQARVVVTALGVLNTPSRPPLPGEEEFAGRIVHAAEWDPSLDLTGKRVAVLGTGCTAVQVVASTADEVAEMAVIQRQPHWIAPGFMVSDPVPEPLVDAMRQVPFLQHWFRLRNYWFASDNNFDKARIDPNWDPNKISRSAANDTLMQVCLRLLDETFGDDAEMKAKLTPDFPPYAKRIIKDPGYLETLKKPHVSLHNGVIEKLTRDSVVISDGTEFTCDVLILATGFQVEYLSSLNIVGRDGVTLRDQWGLDPKAYLGVTVPNFPNFFVTVGPNSAANHGGGHNLVGEEHVHYLMECLDRMTRENLHSIAPTEEATATYSADIDERLDKTVWQHGGTAHGYYRNAAGRARIQNPYRMVDYWHMTRAPRWEDFDVRE